MKRCPYCAEEIQDAAVKCKHCGERLDRPARTADDFGEHVTIPSSEGSISRPPDGPEKKLRGAPEISENGLRYDTLEAVATQEGQPAILGGQYRILKKLGKGGMGVVYLAEDMEMGNRLVAVKVLPPELSDSVRAVENLRREAMIAIDLTHPNIIRLYGFHSDGDMKFLVMEYVDGETLDEKLARNENGKLGLGDMLSVIEKVAAALDYAHSRKQPVFHRDLKPSNIMIGKDGEVRLMDFGIAREMKDSYTSVTGKQDTSGTLSYMSPEQLRGKRPTAAMDIYSLGVVCYECLSGRPPFHTGEITYQILHEPAEPLEDAPREVDGVVRQALAKDAGERPKTGGELVRLLRGQRAEGTERAVPRETGSLYQGTKRLILRTDLIEVPDAEYAPLEGLAEGSREAQDRQRQAVVEIGLPFEVKTAKTGIVFRLIPPGTFTMGEGSDEHKVALTKAFYCGKYPVTQGQWEAVMGSNPSRFKNVGLDAPVESVSWKDCQEFLTKLCRKEGVPEGMYRLPTDAQWEYACRAGTNSAFCFGEDESDLTGYGWHSHNSHSQTHPVGCKRANAWGLYDMHGNVWEWCQDWYGKDYYGKSPPSDPVGAFW